MPQSKAKPPRHLKKRRKPSQERTREAIDKIMAASGEILAEYGVEKLTTRHIAERAGVNVSTLYQFFPNKQSIVFALYEGWINSARNAFLECDEKLKTAKDWRSFFIDFFLVYENIGFTAELEYRLTQAMAVYADLRELDRTFQDWANDKLSKYILHFAPDCPPERAKALAIVILGWDIALADTQIHYHGPVHDQIMDMTMEALLHLLELCVEGKPIISEYPH